MAKTSYRFNSVPPVRRAEAYPGKRIMEQPALPHLQVLIVLQTSRERIAGGSVSLRKAFSFTMCDMGSHHETCRTDAENSHADTASAEKARFGDCHVHLAMDGVDYARAMARHDGEPSEAHVRSCFDAYRARGVTFLRDGGDARGACQLAARIAPEYGIDYRMPAFAIHKRGHYGSIVGRAFSDMREYADLVDEAAALGADFIKIMTTGIMDFNEYGRITHADLPADEVREMVHIAHERGFAVMSHTNGERAVLDAVEAGADSIEHGNYLNEECIAALSESRTCLVPTATVARNLIGSGLFDDRVLTRIWETSRETITAAVSAGCLVALGSDAGAVGVLHAQGALDEYACFADAVPDASLRDARLAQGEAFIRATFARPSS